MPPVAPTPQVSSGRLWVQRTFPGKDESFEEQNLEVHVFASQPAMVKADIARTINTGNYESLKISVGVELPCYPEEVKEGIDRATTMVAAVIQDEEKACRALLSKGSSR